MTPGLRRALLASVSAIALGLATPVAAQNGGPNNPITIQQIETSGQGTTIGPDGVAVSDLDTFDPADGLPRAFDFLPATAPGGNASRVLQDGSFNTSVSAAIGAGNRTGQRQVGNDNQATIDINGNNNSAVTDQDGNDNDATLTIRGSGSAIAAIQLGDDKRIRIEHSGLPTGLVVRQTD